MFFTLLHLLVAAYRGALESGRTSTMGLFAEILNFFKLLTIFAKKKTPSQVVYNCRVSEQFFDLPMGLSYPIELITSSSFT